MSRFLWFSVYKHRSIAWCKTRNCLGVEHERDCDGRTDGETDGQTETDLAIAWSDDPR